MKIAQGISCLIDCLDGVDVKYEPLIKVVFTIVSGEIVRANMICPHTKKHCQMESKELVGGLNDYVIDLGKVIKTLQLEIELEMKMNGDEQ